MTKQSNSRISELHAFDIFFQRHPLAILRSISHGHGRRLREYRYLVEQNLTPVDGTSNTRDADHMGGLQRVPRPSHAASCQDHSPLHQLERISRVRNRMWESRSSGSVGGRGGQPPRLPGDKLLSPGTAHEAEDRPEPKSRRLHSVYLFDQFVDAEQERPRNDG